MVKKITKIILGFGIGVVVIAVCAVIYYQFDDELNPHVSGVLNHTNSISPRENSYYYLLGLYAKKGTKTFDKGLDIVELAKDKFTQAGNVAVLSDSDIKNSHEIKEPQYHHAVCFFDETECLKELVGFKDKFQALRDKYLFLIFRLREAYTIPQFEELPYILSFDHIMSTHSPDLAKSGFRILAKCFIK